jgi:hypothetical protein
MRVFFITRCLFSHNSKHQCTLIPHLSHCKCRCSPAASDPPEAALPAIRHIPRPGLASGGVISVRLFSEIIDKIKRLLGWIPERAFSAFAEGGIYLIRFAYCLHSALCR